LRELLEAQRSHQSEQLSKDQLALFEAAWQARNWEDSDVDDDFGNVRRAARNPMQHQTGNGADVSL
jgi:hypothetical protein